MYIHYIHIIYTYIFISGLKLEKKMITKHLLGGRVSRKIRFNHNTAVVKMDSSTKVKVKQGTVVGGEHTLPNGNPYYYFKGIPYAVPPLGELRFIAPVPLENFPASEIDCTKEGDVCFQKDAVTGTIVGSENCLFLNIFTPKTKSNTSLPVMVFVHGGGYLFGSGNSDFYTPLYLMQEDVVVVTLNYRLGALGFLSLPEGNIPGNAGLKDQHLALQWIKENISAFNGNPNNITLFGESAGAACVHLHVFSENSKKLFHKAIIQSGTANMPWAIQENASYKATKLAKLMGCASENPHEIAKFLKSHPNLIDFLKHLIAVLTPDELRRGLPMPVRPVVENKSAEAIVTEKPMESMRKTDSIDIPIMMGYNSAEGLVMLFNAIKKLEDFDRDLGRLIPRNINLHPEDPKSLGLANMIRDFYFKGAKVDKATLNSFSDVLGDFHFVVDSYVAAEIHARKQHKSPLFFYRFDYVGNLNMYKKLFQFEHLNGACHADELCYLFQLLIAEEPWEDRDKKMVQTTCKLWANFAKYSNPTPENLEPFVDCTWKPVRKIDDNETFCLNAFIIDEKQKMVENPDEGRINFWRNVYRTYNGASTSKL